jgi:hypothetical protein
MNTPNEVSEWSGREVLDANAERIGTIVGFGHPRRKFGATWLLLDIGATLPVLVPAEQMSCKGDWLMLPYPKAYVEGAPAAEPGRPFSQEEERRLRLHYGLGAGSPNTGCSAGCGMCMANRREQPRRSHG